MWLCEETTLHIRNTLLCTCKYHLLEICGLKLRHLPEGMLASCLPLRPGWRLASLRGSGGWLAENTWLMPSLLTESIKLAAGVKWRLWREAALESFFELKTWLPRLLAGWRETEATWPWSTGWEMAETTKASWKRRRKRSAEACNIPAALVSTISAKKKLCLLQRWN